MPTLDAMDCPIADYAIIGDMHSAALINRQARIDWCCMPHFDSPAFFLRILDHAKGGYCAVALEGVQETSRRYLPRTNILETTFKTAKGLLTVTDYMPVKKLSDEGHCEVATEHVIVRRFRCEEGSCQCAVEVRPTIGYAAERTEFTKSGKAIICRGKTDALYLQSPHPLSVQDQSVWMNATLSRGEESFLIIKQLKPAQDLEPFAPDWVESTFRGTLSFWQQWSGLCRYHGEYEEMVVRSLLTLKLLTFDPSGAIIAAATTSLPEEIGGVRNWDYRFTWVRDATFTMVALMNLGYYDEAHEFLRFLECACEYRQDKLQILYGIDGERREEEVILDHLAGYRGSRPVRCGNAAADQRQFDVYGEILDSCYIFVKGGGLDRYEESFENLWPFIEGIGDYVAAHWHEPDSGIWEVRSGLRHWVHSKGMCWVALDHALSLARFGRVRRDLSAWEQACQAIKAELLSKGYNPRIGAFVDSYGSDALDAAVLRLPMLGVIKADDPHMISTVQAIERRLVKEDLVFRYLDIDDGLPGEEGAFAICSFWLANNYLLQGRIDAAEELFRKMLRRANDVGLYAEEIDPETGEFLGNFPQAFTHIALINTAVRLADVHAGKVHYSDAGLVRPRPDLKRK
jgi:alpha,alpha-trehalase